MSKFLLLLSENEEIAKKYTSLGYDVFIKNGSLKENIDYAIDNNYDEFYIHGKITQEVYDEATSYKACFKSLKLFEDVAQPQGQQAQDQQANSDDSQQPQHKPQQPHQSGETNQTPPNPQNEKDGGAKPNEQPEVKKYENLTGDARAYVNAILKAKGNVSEVNILLSMTLDNPTDLIEPFMAHEKELIALMSRKEVKEKVTRQFLRNNPMLVRSLSDPRINNTDQQIRSAFARFGCTASKEDIDVIMRRYNGKLGTEYNNSPYKFIYLVDLNSPTLYDSMIAARIAFEMSKIAGRRGENFKEVDFKVYTTPVEPLLGEVMAYSSVKKAYLPTGLVNENVGSELIQPFNANVCTSETQRAFVYCSRSNISNPRGRGTLGPILRQVEKALGYDDDRNPRFVMSSSRTISSALEEFKNMYVADKGSEYSCAKEEQIMEVIESLVSKIEESETSKACKFIQSVVRQARRASEIFGLVYDDKAHLPSAVLKNPAAVDQAFKPVLDIIHGFSGTQIDDSRVKAARSVGANLLTLRNVDVENKNTSQLSDNWWYGSPYFKKVYKYLYGNVADTFMAYLR